MSLEGLVVPTSGEGEIRTPVYLAAQPVFETGAFNHSATSPDGNNVLEPLIQVKKLIRFGMFKIISLPKASKTQAAYACQHLVLGKPDPGKKPTNVSDQHPFMTANACS